MLNPWCHYNILRSKSRFRGFNYSYKIPNDNYYISIIYLSFKHFFYLYSNHFYFHSKFNTLFIRKIFCFWLPHSKSRVSNSVKSSVKGTNKQTKNKPVKSFTQDSKRYRNENEKNIGRTGLTHAHNTSLKTNRSRLDFVGPNPAPNHWSEPFARRRR